MAKAIIPAVKGTRDFYPNDMAFRSWLYRAIRNVSESFGYQEYDGPFIEKVELYAAKSGEELVKENFMFQDRGGEMVTLRPELTPSLARMVAQRQGELVFPLRWWSFGPFWRYERPQKGRTREFFQWNADIIGANSTVADAELIVLCAKFFKSVGLSSSQVGIRVNERQLLEAEFSRLGIGPDQKTFVFHLLDRREKMAAAEWDAFALEGGLSSAQLDGLKGLLQDKDLWKKSNSLKRVFEIVAAVGLSDYVIYDSQVIRGLDYYTGVVFEARDLDKEGRAILGGGHYDNLVGEVGGEPLPGVGFAMGDVMIRLVLEKYGCLPKLEGAPASVLISSFDETFAEKMFVLATQLRDSGLPVILYPETAKLPKQLKYVDRLGIRFVVIVGPDEDVAGKVTIKDLRNRTQETVDRAELADAIKRML
jgi:histidyl-tRNA synthetase